MSSKEVEERLVISQEKHKVWETRFVECFDEMHNKIRAQLLTTMEIAFPEGIKLEALKSRIRDIQNRVWNTIYKAHNRIFKEHFDPRYCQVKRKGEELKLPTQEEYKTKVEKFNKELDGMIKTNIEYLKSLISNLIVLAEEGLPKQQALRSAVKVITDETYWVIRDWLEGTVDEVFEIK